MKIRHYTILAVLALLFVFGAISPTLAQTASATVNTGNLNVRSGPGVGYGILTTAARGAVVTVIGRNANSSWVQVRTASGVTGWVNAYYLLFSSSIVNLPVTDGSIVNPPPQNPPPAGQTIHIVAAGENLYRISLRYGVSMYAIAQANGLLNLNNIYAGQRLVIP